MTREVLSTLILSSTTAATDKLAVIDVRDSGKILIPATVFSLSL